jgi:hypothetical protein
MVEHFHNDEINVESIAAEMASFFPLDDADACRDILRVLPVLVEQLLGMRRERHARDASA